MLKLYGPSKKKQIVVLITKSKGSDCKFMKILAEKVIKPLLDQILEDQIEDEFIDKKNSVSVAGKELEIKRCSFCDKTSYSDSGLKTHITKMHKQKLKRKRNFCESKDKEIPINEEPTDDSMEITFDQTLENVEENLPKKYSNQCDNCDFLVQAPRKYVALQAFNTHRQFCNKAKSKKYHSCEMCVFKTKDSSIFKNHMRDEHSITTCSTSPPQKRKRQTNVKDDHPVDAVIDSRKEENVEVEEMEIDRNESERLSKKMDKKIKEKEKENEEKERLYNEKQILIAEKKKLDDENKQAEERKQKQKEKQNLKDMRKSINKKMRKSEEDLERNMNKLPNVVNVPKNCQKLVGENDVIYKVPGNGACAPNSAAAHLFSDEIFGPKLRRKMNVFMANHWDKHYKFKTQCSEDHPFERKVGDRMISFTNPEKLKEFLLKSEEASLYMWSDSEDLAVISDMYQIRIKIITSKGNDDKNPTVNWITPAEDLKQFADLKDVQLNDMVLFHENDSHFNLVVDKNDDLATLGSLSVRLNVNPIVNSDEKHEDVEIKKNYQVSDHKNCKVELKKHQEENKNVKKEYFKCEKELIQKTEELEKLKIELNVLKEALKLQKEEEQENLFNCVICNSEFQTKNELNNHVELAHTCVQIACEVCNLEFINKTELVNHMVKDHSERIQEEVSFRCDICTISYKSKAQLQSHKKWKHTIDIQKEEQFNCEGCDFQCTSRLQLNKHINLKHIGKNQPKKDVIKCRICDDQFSEKWNLMNHRKEKHIHTVAFCKKKLEGNCPFTDEKCWWNHQARYTEITQRVECFICGEIFEDKSSLMRHRKTKHTSIIRKCEKFLNDNCPFQSNSCWFIHGDEAMDIDENLSDNNIKVTEDLNNKDKEQETKQTLVFRIFY